MAKRKYTAAVDSGYEKATPSCCQYRVWQPDKCTSQPLMMPPLPTPRSLYSIPLPFTANFTLGPHATRVMVSSSAAKD